MLYTLTAASRILKTSFNRIKWVQVFHKVINVCVKGFSPRFISKKLFWSAFVTFRQESAKNVRVKRIGDRFFQALGKEEIYDLELTPNLVTCTCVDYKNQIEQLKGKGCCKHGYAVLATLGFSTLAEYIAA
jgi:predicted nucleic acid-binding Zn finger protein